MISARGRSTMLSMLAVFIVFLIWLATTEGGFVERKFLPSPIVIAREFAKLVSEGYIGTPLYSHVLASIFRTFTGFACGAAVAIPVGLAIGYSALLQSVLSPFLAMLRPIPVIAYIPLVILWFGIGEFSKILLIAMTSLDRKSVV